MWLSQIGMERNYDEKFIKCFRNKSVLYQIPKLSQQEDEILSPYNNVSPYKIIE